MAKERVLLNRTKTALGLNPVASEFLGKLPLNQAVITDGGPNWNVVLSGMVPIIDLRTGTVLTDDAREETRTMLGLVDKVTAGVSSIGPKPFTMTETAVFLDPGLTPAEKTAFGEEYAAWVKDFHPARTTTSPNLLIGARMEVSGRGILPKRGDIVTLDQLKEAYDRSLT